ncbi:hypothetical protein ACS0TY_023709 [Phlomoides rotata]
MYYYHVVPPSLEDAVGDLRDIQRGIEKIRVLERRILNDYYHKEFTYTVEWKQDGAYISCNCRKFEFKGILCCHIMTVLALKDIQTVNDRYVLSRWRKDVYRCHSSIVFVGGYPHMTDEYKKFQEVEKHFQECTDLAMGSMENRVYQRKMHSDEISQRTEVDGTPILDPRVANPRGRPRHARYMSTTEARGRGRRGRGRGTRTTSCVGEASRGRGVATSIPTAQENNDESFSFDLNEDPIRSQESFVF